MCNVVAYIQRHWKRERVTPWAGLVQKMCYLCPGGQREELQDSRGVAPLVLESCRIADDWQQDDNAVLARYKDALCQHLLSSPKTDYEIPIERQCLLQHSKPNNGERAQQAVWHTGMLDHRKAMRVLALIMDVAVPLRSVNLKSLCRTRHTAPRTNTHTKHGQAKQ